MPILHIPGVHESGPEHCGGGTMPRRRELPSYGSGLSETLTAAS